MENYFKPAEYTDIDQKLASNAFYASSMNPENTGKMYSRFWAEKVNAMHEYLLKVAKNDEQTKVAYSLSETFRNKSKKLLEEWLRVHSNCMSAFVTGPANFPTKKAESASNAADARYNDYNLYCENAKSKYARIIQNTLTQAEKDKKYTVEVRDFFKKLDNDIKVAQAIAKKSKGSVPSYIKTNMIQSLKSRFETLWSNRQYNFFNEALDKIAEAQKEEGVVLFAPSNSIWERWDGITEENLNKSKDLQTIINLCNGLYSKSKEELENFNFEGLNYYINYHLNKLSGLQRFISLKIAVEKIEQTQRELNISILPSDHWVYKTIEKNKQVQETAQNDSVETSDIYVAEGLRIEDNIEEQKVRLYFDGKPEFDIRNEIKSHGFKWAPSQMAWQRKNTPEALRYAIEFGKKFYPNEIKEESSDNDQNEVIINILKIAIENLQKINSQLREKK